MVSDWCRVWGMMLTLEKCKVMHVVRSNPKAIYVMMNESGNELLEGTNSIKYNSTSGTTNMKFHHDNTRPNVTKLVKSHLNDAKFTIINHSLDQAPFDYSQTSIQRILRFYGYFFGNEHNLNSVIGFWYNGYFDLTDFF